VAIHGFLEDWRYFTGLYCDPAVELICINSGGYHCPDNHAATVIPDWSQDPPYPLGTIAYDAHVLNQALVHLGRGRKVRVHGHSRGGAVVLEAARHRPELFETVEAVLEAPVLPGGEAHPALALAFNRVARYLLPFNFALMRRIPAKWYARWVFRPLNPRKLALVSELMSNPRTDRVALTNANDIESWMKETDSDIYDNLPRGCVLIAESDLVLDRRRMIDSAVQAEGLQVRKTEGTSHFVTLDRPESLPVLGQAVEASQSDSGRQIA
jgi:pimeloyl-ACP methyl ester carboxylesterase